MDRCDGPNGDLLALGLACWRGHPGLMPHSHRHREVELNFVEEGSIRYLFGGTQVPVGAGRLAVFWAAVPHQLVRVEPHTIYVWLTVPLARVLQWQLPTRLTNHLLHGKLVVDPERDRLRADQLLFGQWYEDLRSGRMERRTIVLLEVEARLRRLALVMDRADDRASGEEVANAPLRQENLTKADQMAHFIAAHYTETLQVEDIAQAVNLHPNYAMKLFRETFGMTLMEYVTEYRVAHAQRLLATTDQTVLDIALECGFGSVSRFYAAFRHSCGQSPRKYRQTLRSSL